jgi:hypothetical protein
VTVDWWRRRRVAGLLLALLVVLLAGCAGSRAQEGSSVRLPRYYDPAQLVAALEQQKRTHRTARIRLSGEVIGSSTRSVVGDGELRLGDDGAAVRLTQVLSEQGVEPVETAFVVLPGSVYVRRSAPGSWTRVDRSTPDRTARRLAAMAATLTDGADPTANLTRYGDAALIADAADDVVDGVPAVRYKIVVDLTRAASEQQDHIVRAQLEAQVKGGLTRISALLWVDAEHRPVRSAVRQYLPGFGTFDLVSTYRDWGAPVAISAPV